MIVNTTKLKKTIAKNYEIQKKDILKNVTDKNMCQKLFALIDNLKKDKIEHIEMVEYFYEYHVTQNRQQKNNKKLLTP